MKEALSLTAPSAVFTTRPNPADLQVGGRLDGGQTSWRSPALLLIAYAAIWLALAIAPVSRADWLLENLLVLIIVPWLIVTRQRMRFSNAAYACFFVFFVLHAIGAHFTYSLVPYDRWLQALGGRSLSELLALDRNHYDRLVHFSYGALVLLPAIELFERYAPPTGPWRWWLPVLFVTSHAVIYELLEWIAALVVAPDLGNAYLGTQGDVWDAQKDMALALAGTMLALGIIVVRRRFTTRSTDPASAN